jgi:pimeloyl-ACP methyl ester carboxylesterase
MSNDATIAGGRTAAIEGMQMYFEVHGAGEPLLLLHGFTGAGSDWGHVFEIQDLARRFQVIVPDLRGHGRSSNPGGAFTHRQCALDVSALLDHLGIASVRAVGMSLGGNTLLHLATRERARVSAMVLISATMHYPAPARAIMRAMTDEGRSPEDWAMMRGRHRQGDEQIRALWRHARGFADSYDDMTFTAPHLGTVGARTLIVYGDRDPLYPVEMAVEMYRAIPGAALWVVPGGGHVPIFVGEEKDRFVRTALDFLGAAPAAA